LLGIRALPAWRLGPALRDVVLPHLRIERRAAEAQEGGGGLLVPPRRLERLDDRGALDLLDELRVDRATVIGQSLGGGRPNGTDNATVNLQFSIVSNELVSTKILLCPNDVGRVAATNFATLFLTNISYALCNEADEKRPRVILATDRNLSGFDFTGLPDNINCFILTSPDTGARSAKWRRSICHGSNSGIVALGDGSVHRLNDVRLVQTLVSYDPSTETDGGNLQFYFP